MNHIIRLSVLSILLFNLLLPTAFSRNREINISDGYEISVQLKPFKNCNVILAYYYGDQLKIVTTTYLNNNSEAVFKGNTKLHQGIYVVYEETNKGNVDFLVDSNQHFSVQAEFGDTYQLINFLNSSENELLKNYKQFMAFKQVDISNYREQLASTTYQADSVVLIHQLRLINDTIQQYREDLIAKYPGTFFSTLLVAMKEPILPEKLQNPKDSADSAAVKYYTKIHFWDGVNFWDGRLTYTPFFSSKLEKYYTEVVGLKADSAIKQIDWMMSTAGANEEMTHLVLEKLFFGTMYHQYKWEDAVFIHLFEKYIAQKTYTWLQPEDRKTLTDHAYLLMANNKGTKAYEIMLPGLEAQKESLLGVKARYTLLCFWDVTCSHCRETLPVLDSLYQANWKNKGLKIYAVSVESDGNRDNWLSYIKAYHLEEWTNVYYSMNEEKEKVESGAKPALQPYNIWYYPSFYLLDQDKRFMAKKLSYPQIAELINSILNKKN
jgi:thiol-disulfide isomerase/thioredoxin